MDSFLMWQKYYSSMLTAISYFFLAVGIHILFRVATRPALRHESWSVLSILELLLPACQFLSELLFGANLGPGWPYDPIWPFSNHWGWEEQPLDTQCTLFFYLFSLCWISIAAQDFSSCGARISHRSGFSCAAQAVGHTGFSHWGSQAQLPHGIWEPSSQTRHGTHVLCTGRQSPNHWATSEVLTAQLWKVSTGHRLCLAPASGSIN